MITRWVKLYSLGARTEIHQLKRQLVFLKIKCQSKTRKADFWLTLLNLIPGYLINLTVRSRISSLWEWLIKILSNFIILSTYVTIIPWLKLITKSNNIHNFGAWIRTVWPGATSGHTEYWTSSDFEWSNLVTMLNGSDLEWHSKTKQHYHSKSDKLAAIMDFFSNGRDYSCSYDPDHSDTKPSLIWTSKHWILNGFWIWMFGIQVSNEILNLRWAKFQIFSNFWN